MQLDEEACRARLGASGHGVLGTVHPERGVDMVPVVFAVHGDAIVIPIDTVKAKLGARLQRLVNLTADARCGLLVDRYDDDWAQLWWVRAHGRASETAPDDAALQSLGDAFPAYRTAGAVTSTIVLRIERLTGWSADPDPF